MGGDDDGDFHGVLRGWWEKICGSFFLGAFGFLRGEFFDADLKGFLMITEIFLGLGFCGLLLEADVALF